MAWRAQEDVAELRINYVKHKVQRGYKDQDPELDHGAWEQAAWHGPRGPGALRLAEHVIMKTSEMQVPETKLEQLLCAWPALSFTILDGCSKMAQS